MFGGDGDIGMNLDAITALSFSMAANPGVYALLIGSGVSRAAQIPTGWEIVVDLAARLAAAEGETPADPVAWYRTKYGEAPEYSALVEALATTAAERRSLLHAYIEATTSDPDETRRRPVYFGSTTSLAMSTQMFAHQVKATIPEEESGG